MWREATQIGKHTLTHSPLEESARAGEAGLAADAGQEVIMVLQNSSGLNSIP